eukprot:1516817-Prymnesium_polylepis.1
MPLDVSQRRGSFVLPQAMYKPKPGYAVVHCMSKGGRGRRGLVRDHVQAQRWARERTVSAD